MTSIRRSSHYTINKVLSEILDQTKRHTIEDGAELLKNDLEIITLKIAELSALLPPCVTPSGRTDSHGVYVIARDGETVCSFCNEKL